MITLPVFDQILFFLGRIILNILTALMLDGKKNEIYRYVTGMMQPKKKNQNFAHGVWAAIRMWTEIVSRHACFIAHTLTPNIYASAIFLFNAIIFHAL